MATTSRASRRTAGCLVTASLLLTACHPEPEGVPDGPRGEPIPAPRRFAPEWTQSCPRLFALQNVEGRLSAVIHEQTVDRAFLGRELLEGAAWTAEAPTEHRPFHIGSLEVSTTPQGDVAAALYPQTGTAEYPELRRTGAGGWEPVPFEVGLDRSAQNFPTVVALGPDRMAVSIWESKNGQGRQRSFVLSGDTWTPLEEYVAPSSRTLHRAPSGALWRATPDADHPETVRFEEWNGLRWDPLPWSLSVGRAGYLRTLASDHDRLYALYDTTHSWPGGAAFELHELTSDGPRLLATSPSPDLWLTGLSFDSAGRPVISGSGVSAEGTEYVAAFRLEDGVWRTVYVSAGRGGRFGGGQAAIVDDVLYVGGTETSQSIDTGFAHYSDCTLTVERVALPEL